jgi:hypothetical protein
MVMLEFIQYSNAACKKSVAIPFDMKANDSKCVYVIEDLDAELKALGLNRSNILIRLYSHLTQPSSTSEAQKEEKGWEIVSDIQSIENVYFPCSLELVKELKDPKLEVEIRMDEQNKLLSHITVTCMNVGLYVWLESDVEGYFSRNGCVMYPMKPLQLTFKAREKALETASQLQIRSYYDTFY